MPDIDAIPDEADAARRRRLCFRAWHRGTREMDLLLGRFADAHVAAMPDADLLAFEALMHEPDPDLYVLITAAAAPADAPAMIARLRRFHGVDFDEAEEG